MIKRSAKIFLDKKTIVGILRKNGVEKAGVFGSFTRGEAREKSDIDILVKLKKGRSLLDLAGLELQLEKKLGRKIDLLTYDSLHPLLRKKILKDEVKLL